MSVKSLKPRRKTTATKPFGESVAERSSSTMKKMTPKFRSAASPPRVADFQPRCFNHLPQRVFMEPAEIEARYPGGILVSAGFRCPRCGDEAFTADQVERDQKEARRLGLFGIEQATTRTLQRTGTSVTVSLDPVLLRDVLRHAKPGTKVKVGRHGDHVAIEAE